MALVLFFDGDCGFCSKSVVRVYRLDPVGAFEFAPLQGVLAAKLGLRKYAEKGGGSMVILRESDGVMFIKGDAWILLGETLGGVWAGLASVFSLFPNHVRDRIYDLIAKNRYLIAGKGNRCTLPDEGLRKRMRE
ncbi:MAG: hypothetical protein RLZZ505_2639 [Verrucomicrobiota bacterium]|jgi:predicted DCC family thiol-disulfide oxidoreductase YuxK